MNDREARLALKASLPRTWPAFFAAHGNFTATQVAVIPSVLAGEQVIVCAPTASGKTEAAVAPLVERHCLAGQAGLLVLYITPTRALANDLLKRLGPPLAALGVTLSIKTRDQNTFDATRPATVLLSTPESVDSLLTSQARVFATLRAVVLDELHLFDGTPRGDQLRVVLNRLRRVRAHAFASGDAPDAHLQFVALSATLDQPQRTAERYFDGARVIAGDGPRPFTAELISLGQSDVDALRAYLYRFRERGWRKALVFCNSRAEVEAYAAAVRRGSPFGDAVYVHYSNIARQRRREIEHAFAAAEAAVCFATNTLELGIDIGDIDTVILIGPPGDQRSFAQRIGRGNRRGSMARVACFFRTPYEKLVFETLCAPDLAPPPAPPPPFHLSVAVQQIFSLLKQNPSGAVRLPELNAYFAGLLAPADVRAILGELLARRYLQVGRPGEWRAGPKLNDLVDWQAAPNCPLSLYSNIPSQEASRLEIRDQHTHQTVASASMQWLGQPVLILEGRPVAVEWVDGEAIWVAAYRGGDAAEHLLYRSAQKHLSYELASQLPLALGLPRGAAPLVQTATGWGLVHCLGDVYGHVFADLLRRRTRLLRGFPPALGVMLPEKPVPALWLSWTDRQVAGYLEENYRALERLLALGPFQRLLPSALRRRAVVEQFRVPTFLDAVASLRLLPVTGSLADRLLELV